MTAPSGCARRKAFQAAAVLAPGCLLRAFLLAVCFFDGAFAFGDSSLFVSGCALAAFLRLRLFVALVGALDGGVSASSAWARARRLTGPRTGALGTYTQPTPGIGLPPIRRPSSKSHSWVPWNSWNESLLSDCVGRSATCKMKVSPRPMTPAGGVMISLSSIAWRAACRSLFAPDARTRRRR